tara:strand:+ start:55 stop:273 length:219 start_codon:yes stop_codon:yes gene_type:complete
MVSFRVGVGDFDQVLNSCGGNGRNSSMYCHVWRRDHAGAKDMVNFRVEAGDLDQVLDVCGGKGRNSSMYCLV